jgi:putative photosynthetic complex assembly protein
MDALKALAASPYPDPSHPLPRPIIAGGSFLMVAAVALCAVAHATGVGVTASPAPVAVASRDLVFTETDDGLLRVAEPGPGGRELSRFEGADGGFIRAMVRGLIRNRTRYGEPAVGAFRVSRDAEGAIWLQDVATRQNVDLRAFGPTQVEAFAQFVPAPDAPR